MQLNLIMNINSDRKQKMFLRENSYWYKYLNRSNNYYKDFLNDMKQKYKLTPTDRLNKIINDVNTFKAFLDVLK